MNKNYFSKNYLIFATSLISIFVVYVYINYKHEIQEGKEILKKSTNLEVINKVLSRINVKMGTYTFTFNDDSKFVFHPLLLKKGYVDDFVFPNDTISKESNSNQVFVKSVRGNFYFYITADTTNTEWKKKNLPNTHYAD